ncbi:unnamed protein product [Moneuplotes crassus]|uniref:GAR domain-containing protein n=1 Tax=Euplotes crassus TaxID=5936 RepID=A0AAD1Y716_EUPCR|nr:unnamed protein product [Moneuplotes crassus]
MDFFRSATMDLYEVSIPKDNAWEAMDLFGKLNSLHFVNLNKNEQVFNLTYASRVKRCDEAMRKLSTILESEANRIKLPMYIPSNLDNFRAAVKIQSRLRNRSSQAIFEIIEEDIQKYSKFILDQKENEEGMHNQCLKLIEKRAVMAVASTILKKEINNKKEESEILMREGDNEIEAREELLGEARLNISHIAGTINQSEKERLQRMIFRATRGTALSYFQDIAQPFISYKGDKTYKTVFIIIYQDGEYYTEKLRRILSSFMTNIFEIDSIDINQEAQEASKRIKEFRDIMKKCYGEIKEYLKAVNTLEGTQISKIQLYKLYLAKEKYLYENLNKMKIGRNLFIGLFWLPASEVPSLKEEIIKFTEEGKSKAPQIFLRKNHDQTPPTFIRTNDFTAPFQEITDTYGVPNYKEVNPSYFGIVTFPFLFGVMFGDVGHGALLFLLGAFLCIQVGFLKKSALSSMIPYRYLILLMGIFATFCGACYNDMMSIPIEMSKSCINLDEDGDDIFEEDCVYPFGVDHTWYLASNNLAFLNSLKMKIAVIFGVSQMSLGILMKAMNAIHFRQSLDFFYEFVPQIILLLSLFGFMDFLIIMKWLTPWEDKTNRAPGIIGLMINMFLNFGQVNTETTDPLIGDAGTQQAVCIILLIVALFCVPTMLVVKPLFLRHELKHMHDKSSSSSSSDRELKEYQSSEHEGGEEEEKLQQKPIMNAAEVTQFLDQNKTEENHNFSEICIHQLIETIEFVLGTVSNTASYLRLWALSLAHGQLAHVFFDKLLESFALSGSGNAALLFLLFPVFFSFTFFVLMCMDSMECFLHTLRLHWVEFQNKFFKGNGYKFVPFSFSSIIEAEILKGLAPNIFITNEDVDSDYHKSEIELPPLPERKSEESVKSDKQDNSEIEEEKQPQEEEKEVTKDPKQLLYQDVKNFAKDISINKNNLGDARERLTILMSALKTNSELLAGVHIEDSDPPSILNPSYDYLASFDDYSNTQKELNSDISNIEVFITKISNLQKEKELLQDYSEEELQDMIGKVETTTEDISEINKKLEQMSIEQGAKISNLEAFLDEARTEQFARCDFTENIEVNTEIESKDKFCQNLLTKIQNIVDNHPEEMSDTRGDVLNDIIAKIPGWEERYQTNIESRTSLLEAINNLKSKVSEHQDKTLNMNIIREIISHKEENLDENNQALDDIEKLINEIKILELEFTECEEKDQVRKAILDDLLPKVSNLADNYGAYPDCYETRMHDLEKLRETLEMMTDHEDYPEDQESIVDLKNRVSESIAKIEEINDNIESSKELIEDILNEEEYSLSNEIPFLESKLHNVNKVLKKLTSGLEVLDQIEATTTSYREELDDAHIDRNNKTKNADFCTFRDELASLKGKYEMVFTRVEQEKEDPRLNDNHREIISEVETILQDTNDKISELSIKQEEDEKLLGEIIEIVDNTELKTTDYDVLKNLISLIEQVKVSEVDALGPVNKLSADLDNAILSLDKIDYAQENDPKYALLDQLTLSTDELLKSIRFMKSVFDSTEGYTSSQEEDSQYDRISADLGELIVRLIEINEKVDDFKSSGDVENINEFLGEQDLELQQIQEALFNHSLVLQSIPWGEKLGRRIEELKEEQGDVEVMVEEGRKIQKKLEKMKDKASKNEEANEEILEKIEYHLELVTTNLQELEDKKEDMDSIEEDIKEFDEILSNRNNNDFKEITNLLKKNKEIKEKIEHIDATMDNLDAEIDNVAPFIAENKKLIKKKYKVKKGDELDEAIASFVNNSDIDVPIKRTDDGKYMIGDKKISATLRNGKLLIRVGGGYQTLQEYMETIGEAKLRRHARKAKREKRKNRKSERKPRVLNKTGGTDVVGSADLMKSWE